MSKKPKFEPVMTRIKLNPEQAVLSCNCTGLGARHSRGPCIGAGGIPGCKTGGSRGAHWGGYPPTAWCTGTSHDLALPSVASS